MLRQQTGVAWVFEANAIFNKDCMYVWLRYLHKKSSHQSLPDVKVVITTVEVCAATCEVESVHNSSELFSYIVGRLE